MKHLKHKKGFSALLIGAAVLSVGTVGFSAWVITGPNIEKESGTVGVTVAAVNDTRVSAGATSWYNQTTLAERQTAITGGTWSDTAVKTIVDGSSNAIICFGPKAGDSAGLVTASGYGANDLESLYVGFTTTLSCDDFSKINLSLSLHFDFGEGTLAKLVAGQAGTYITNPFTYTTENNVTTVSDVTLLTNATVSNVDDTAVTGNSNVHYILSSYSSGSVVVTTWVKWTWGTKFSGANPSIHSHQDTATNLDTLKGWITAMNTAMNFTSSDTITMTLVVTSTPKASA